MRAVQTAAEDVDRISGGRVELASSTLHDLSIRWRAWRVPRLQSPSILIDGVDLRPQLPVPSIDLYLGSIADRTKEMIARIRGQKPHTLTLPLVVPDAQAPYLGYEKPRTWYPREVGAGSREVYDLVAAGAAALYAKRSRIMVNSKRQGLEGFISSGDEWSPFVREVRDLVLRLNYALPQSEEDRQELRAICERLVDFEAYTLDQLREELSTRPYALWRRLRLRTLDRIQHAEIPIGEGMELGGIDDEAEILFAGRLERHLLHYLVAPNIVQLSTLTCYAKLHPPVMVGMTF
jgi:hypothetical protein